MSRAEQEAVAAWTGRSGSVRSLIDRELRTRRARDRAGFTAVWSGFGAGCAVGSARWSTKRVAAAGSSASLGEFLRSLPAIASLARYIRGLVTRRRAAPQDDLITALVRAEESGDRLTEDEIVSMVILLLLAGYETTFHLIATGALTLMQHPQQRLRMQETAELRESAIDEILRYASPVEFSTPRLTLEDVTLGLVTIPRGELVAVSLGSANHDELQFPDPETFDVAREPNKHVAFGMGSHFCLGAALARLEGEIALTTLFRRLPGLHLAVPPDSLLAQEPCAARPRGTPC